MNQPTDDATKATALTFERIGAALVLCATNGEVLQITPEARRLFERFELSPELGDTIETGLWNLLAEHRLGDQVEWQPTTHRSELLGISRYPAGDAHYLLMMREVTDQRQELARRLHRQRLECVGRLIASVSHDLRTVASSIVYNAEVLSRGGKELNPSEFSDTVREIAVASQHLSMSVDGLLGYARLGPQIAVPVALEAAIGRAMALVRRIYRESEHRLVVALNPEASHVVGNPLLVDQILVNLLVNAAESSERAVAVRITTERLGGDVKVSIHDSGPGVPEPFRGHLFRPFFTTKSQGTGVGLAVAREAARELGGDLCWVPSETGARFVLSLPAHLAPETAVVASPTQAARVVRLSQVIDR